jgi:hypothetical protein
MKEWGDGPNRSIQDNSVLPKDAIGDAKIRLEGIDAPETDQICLDAVGARSTCGIEARDRLSQHIAGRSIDCTSTGQDRYHRTLASCRLEIEDLSAWMNERLQSPLRRDVLELTEYANNPVPQGDTECLLLQPIWHEPLNGFDSPIVGGAALIGNEIGDPLDCDTKADHLGFNRIRARLSRVAEIAGTQMDEVRGHLRVHECQIALKQSPQVGSIIR